MKKALLIGINYFNTSGQLNGCHNDVIKVKGHLESLGYQSFEILLDNPEDMAFKLPSCPTRKNILDTYTRILRELKSGDEFFMHYSGHGSYIRDRNGDERDKRDEVICPVDNTLIVDDELYAILAANLAPGVKVRAVFDCCHSGSVLDLPFRFTEGNTIYTENNYQLSRDVIMISGCRDDQVSWDAMINGQYSGALTWAFLKALADFRVAGGAWSWRDLIAIMRYLLRTSNYDQIPQLSMTHRDHLHGLVDLL